MKWLLIGLLLIPLSGIVLFKFLHYRTVSECIIQGVKHLGIIMDGNRRWARERGMPSSLGHKEGVGPLKTAIAFCIKHKIPYLTVYAFSLENLKRSQDELDYLFKVLAKELSGKELDSFIKKGIQIRIIGDASYYPQDLKNIIKEAEEKTQNGKNLIFSILFCYGGQQEIVAAAQHIAHEVQQGKLDPATITPQTFTQYTWMGNVPPPDIIIRTGKAQRLSNFLTFQSSYSEIYFLPYYWPEITEHHLEKVCEQFSKTIRNFGA